MNRVSREAARRTRTVSRPPTSSAVMLSAPRGVKGRGASTRRRHKLGFMAVVTRSHGKLWGVMWILEGAGGGGIGKRGWQRRLSASSSSYIPCRK